MTTPLRALLVAAGAWLVSTGASLALVVVGAVAASGGGVSRAETLALAVMLLAGLLFLAGTVLVCVVLWRTARSRAGRWLGGLGYAAVAGGTWLLVALFTLLAFNR